MLGESMVPWFNVFSGIVVYKVKPDGVSDNDMWININEYVKIFERDNLRLNGIPYEKETGREEEVINAIIANSTHLISSHLMIWSCVTKSVTFFSECNIPSVLQTFLNPPHW